MEVIRAKMLLEGYNASGHGAHEAEVSFMRILGFNEKNVQFADQIRYFRNYLAKDSKQDRRRLSTGSHKRYEADVDDIKLLRLISTHAKMSLLELGKQLDIPATIIKYRLRRMEKAGVIVAYRAIINYHKLGYEYYKVDLILEDLDSIPGLVEYIRTQPNILYRDVTAGGSDFEFDMEVKCYEDFVQIINEITALFPEKIRTYSYYKTLAVHKYHYFPEKLAIGN